MFRKTALFLSASLISGCFIIMNQDKKKDEEINGFKEAIPDETDLQVRMGQSDTGATSGTKDNAPACVDDQGNRITGPLYQATRNAVWDINSGILNVFMWLKAIVSSLPPEVETADGYVWGPWTPDLSRITFRLVMQVVDLDLGKFHFSLQGKLKNDTSDENWLDLIEGDVRKGEDPFHGTGTLNFYFENTHTLDETMPRAGKAEAVFQTNEYPYTVHVTFTDFSSKNDDTHLLTAEYDYTKEKDLSGEFSFSAYSDIEGDGQVEDLDVLSRWRNDGTGRSDARVSGGSIVDLGINEVTLSECWDDMYYATHLHSSVAMTDLPDCGDSTTCIYSDTKLP